MMPISSVIYHREEITLSDLAELDRLMEAYPYFSNLYVWKAKALHDSQNEEFTNALPKAASRTISRKRLKHLIEGPLNLDFNWEEQKPENQDEPNLLIGKEVFEEIELEIESTEIDEVKEEEAIAIEKVMEENPQPEMIPVQIPKNDFGFKFVKTTKPKSEKNKAQTGKLKKEVSGEQSVPKVKKGDQKDAIDYFLEKNPSISSPKLDFGNSGPLPDLSARSTRLEEEIVTENMAMIYLKQRNFAKALDIYRKLELKFPEKSAYFAALIKNLENTIA